MAATAMVVSSAQLDRLKGKEEQAKASWEVAEAALHRAIEVEAKAFQLWHHTQLAHAAVHQDTKPVPVDSLKGA